MKLGTIGTVYIYPRGGYKLIISEYQDGYILEEKRMTKAEMKKQAEMKKDSKK